MFRQTSAPIRYITVIWASIFPYFYMSDDRSFTMHSKSILFIGGKFPVFPVFLLHLRSCFSWMSSFSPSHKLPPHEMITCTKDALRGGRSLVVCPSSYYSA